LALTARQRAGLLQATFLQARKQIKHIGQAVAPLRIAQAHLAVTAQHEVVFHAHGAEQFALFGHQGNTLHHAFFQGQRVDGLAIKFNQAFAWDQAHQRIQQGGLARTIGADDGDHAAFGGFQAQPVQHFGFAVACAQVGDFE
jgi:hypothetical protein